MIGLLRFVGLMNAAVWFGATVFFMLGVGPAPGSSGMEALLGPKNFPYFSVAIGQIFCASYFHLYLACSIVASLHLLTEWLYLGRTPHRFWVGLVFGLFLVGLAQSTWLQPRLKELHRLQFTRPDLRDAAARAFLAWETIAYTLNFLVLCALAVYLWRLANPPDPARFVSAAKFRS